MDLVHLAIWVVVVVAVVAVVAWFIRASGLVIPQPLMLCLYAVLAILAILFVAGLAGTGPLVVR